MDNRDRSSIIFSQESKYINHIHNHLSQVFLGIIWWEADFRHNMIIGILMLFRVSKMSAIGKYLPCQRIYAIIKSGLVQI